MDVLTIGEALGLLVPDRVGRMVHVRGMHLTFGGAESNVAIGVARLGGSAAWLGRLGADGVGEIVRRELRAEGVHAHVVVDDEASTALMLKERPQEGRSKVTYYRDRQAGSRLSPGDVPEGLVERAGLLHVTGISAGLGESPQATIVSAMDRARAAGVPVSFDVNHRSALWRDGRDAGAAYRELAGRADVVFAGEDAARLLPGEHTAAGQLAAIHASGARCAVVKCGARGAVASEDGRTVQAEAVPVRVVDTVGAGDAFVAGWLSETIRGASLSERLQVAVACGAHACTGEGDWEASASRQDLAHLAAPGSDDVQR